MARKYYIETKVKDCLPLDEWITKLEMRAFGWVYKGVEIEHTGVYEIDFDWDHDKAYVSEGKNVYIMFKRVKPYSRSCLFNLLELIMSIQSWIRRKLIYLFFGMTALALGIGLIETCSTGRVAEGLVLGIGVIIFVYAPSLITALLAFLIRKFSRMDEKLYNDLENNGYEGNQRL